MDLILQNQFFILLGFLAIGFAVGAWMLVDQRRKMRMILGGKEMSDEPLLRNILQRLFGIEQRVGVLEPRMDAAEDIGRMSISRVAFLRYNPFSDTGGDNSFSVALLDSENTGVVVSSLYTREGVRTYAKRITRGRSSHPLSDEEKRVVEEAMAASKSQ